MRRQKLDVAQIFVRRSIGLKLGSIGAPAGCQDGEAIGLDGRQAADVLDQVGQPTQLLHDGVAVLVRELDDLPQPDGRGLRVDRAEAEDVDPV